MGKRIASKKVQMLTAKRNPNGCRVRCYTQAFDDRLRQEAHVLLKEIYLTVREVPLCECGDPYVLTPTWEEKKRRAFSNVFVELQCPACLEKERLARAEKERHRRREKFVSVYKKDRVFDGNVDITADTLNRSVVSRAKRIAVKPPNEIQVPEKIIYRGWEYNLIFVRKYDVEFAFCDATVIFTWKELEDNFRSGQIRPAECPAAFLNHNGEMWKYCNYNLGFNLVAYTHKKKDYVVPTHVLAHDIATGYLTPCE